MLRSSLLWLAGFFLPALLLTGAPGSLPAQQTGTRITAEEVTLQPGDFVEVQIWREEELSGEFPVDLNGVVTFPLLGEIRVTGIPMGELRGVLIEEYRVHLRNPSINITPMRRVNILGEVQQPGLYPVDPTISLAGAVALAGGATPNGDLNRIRVIRDGQVLQDRVAAGTPLNVVDIRSGDQIFVDRRGWFERNSTFVVSTLISVTSIIISLSN